MIPYILFPHYFKWLGIILFIAGFVTGAVFQPNIEDVKNGMSLLVQVMILIGLLLVCCAKEKVEDEFIQSYRLASLQWAVLVLIALRVGYKVMAWYTQDESWTPHWQVNSLLIIYLLLFYYQLYIKEYVLSLFKKEEGE